jgi:hypothetical protein
MGRGMVYRSLGLLLLGSGPLIAVAGDDPPPLSAPSLTPPALSPTTGVGSSTGLPSAIGRGSDPPIAIESRSMLVVPGVNSPGRVLSRRAPLPALETAAPGSLDEAPRLIDPSDLLGSSTPEPTRLPTQPTSLLPTTATATGRSLPHESPPAPATDAMKPVTAFSTASAPPGATAADPPPAPADDSGRRSPGILGRFLSAPFATWAARGGDDRESITVEPSTDPAAEAALKRRVERQIRESLGDRVRDVEVRVLGRDVTIRARANHFWQRRTVRRTLETLPGLSGYHTSAHLLD